MASYNILFDRDVEKDLRKIPRQYARRITMRLLQLANDRHPPQSAKIEGTDSVYRLRIGDYRAVYYVDDRERTVTIYRVRHRKDIYKTF